MGVRSFTSKSVHVCFISMSVLSLMLIFQNCKGKFSVEETSVDITNSLLSAPSISFNNTSDITNSSSVVMSFDVQGASDITCSLNGGASQNCSTKTMSYSSLADGDYIFEVVAISNAGVSSTERKNFSHQRKLG